MHEGLPEHLRPRRRGDENLRLELSLLCTALAAARVARSGHDGTSPWPMCGGTTLVALVLVSAHGIGA